MGLEGPCRVVLQILLPKYCHLKDLVLGFQVAWEGGGIKDLTTFVTLHTSQLPCGGGSESTVLQVIGHRGLSGPDLTGNVYQPTSVQQED